MEIDFRVFISGFIFVGGVPAIIALVEWIKRVWENMPKSAMGLLPVIFGLILNVGIFATLGFFTEYGIIAIVTSIIMGILAGLAAEGIYDMKSNVI